MSTVGIVFSNIHDDLVPELTRNRTIASVPFGGRYRLVDFALSNMVNSGISKVGVITKSNYQSLMDHVGSGKEWDLARKNGGLIILPPYGDRDSSSIYNTRLQALKGILSFLQRSTEDYVVMTDCNCVCKVDYDKILESHIKRKADITLVYKEKQLAKGERIQKSSVFTLDEESRITEIVSSDNIDGNINLFLNIFVMKKTLLQNIVLDAIARGLHHFTGDILSKNLKSLKIYGYKYDGYFQTINSIESYFNQNMNLLKPEVRDELFGDRSIYTKVRDSAPAKLLATANVKNSLIADGCEIEGEVINSILFRGVRVKRGAVVENSIIMQDSVIEENAKINCVIADKNVTIKSRRVLSGCETHPFFIAKGNMV